MFQKRKIPERVIAFGRKLTWQIAELDVHDAYTEQARIREFNYACEDVNQRIIKAFENALPMVEEGIDSDYRSDIVRMRVIQLKHDGFYVLEKQFFVRARNAFGLVFWYRVTEDSIRMQSKLFESKQYKFRCIGRTISVPRTELKVKDFYYKL